jgi:hypothetical protein
MVDDIFAVKCIFELPSGAASFELFYQQDLDHTPLLEVRDADICSEAFAEDVVPELLACIADDVRMPVVQARHVARDNGDNVKLTYERDIQPAAGTQLGPSLPNNCAMMVKFTQQVFPKRTVGKTFIPGVPEAQTDKNILLAGFVNGPVLALLNKLQSPITSTPNGGSWKPVIRSFKAYYAPVQAWKDGGMVGPRPDPDWYGSIADVTGISLGPAIRHQKRRGTKVRGMAS